MKAQQWTSSLAAVVTIVALSAGITARQSMAAGASSGASLSAGDRRFVTEVATGGAHEVEMGKLALEKASSDSVKQFAQRLVDDHSQANQELTRLASKRGVDLPSQPGPDPARERLAKLSGPAFDREFMKDTLSDHKKDVAKFHRIIGRTRDADLKAWVNKTLPTLEEHLKMVQRLQASKER